MPCFGARLQSWRIEGLSHRIACAHGVDAKAKRGSGVRPQARKTHAANRGREPGTVTHSSLDHHALAWPQRRVCPPCTRQQLMNRVGSRDSWGIFLPSRSREHTRTPVTFVLYYCTAATTSTRNPTSSAALAYVWSSSAYLRRTLRRTLCVAWDAKNVVVLFRPCLVHLEN